MTSYRVQLERCPRCDSHSPALHPAVQHEGEVQICPHPFHGDTTPAAEEPQDDDGMPRYEAVLAEVEKELLDGLAEEESVYDSSRQENFASLAIALNIVAVAKPQRVAGLAAVLAFALYDERYARLAALKLIEEYERDQTKLQDQIGELGAAGLEHKARIREVEAERDNATERLRLAKRALVLTGYFTADEISDDIAPRITEFASAKRVELEATRADLVLSNTRREEANERVRWLEDWSNDITLRMPEEYDGDEDQETIILRWIDDVLGEWKDAQTRSGRYRLAWQNAYRRAAGRRQNFRKMLALSAERLLEIDRLNAEIARRQS